MTTIPERRNASSDDIPDRIWEEARQLRNVVNWTSNASVEAIAMFLLAAEKRGREKGRERCLQIAENFSAMRITESDDGRIGDIAFACFNEAASQRADMIAAAIRSTS